MDKRFPGESSSRSRSSSTKLTLPKIERDEDLELPLNYDSKYSTQLGDNVASSSTSNLSSYFIGMGFSSSLVHNVIKEKGEEDVEMILEALVQCSDAQNSNSSLSYSLDSLFDDKDAHSIPRYSTVLQPKEEPDVLNGVQDNKRASLLKMDFSANEVDFAMRKLGEDAPLDEIIEVIIAAQIPENRDQKGGNVPIGQVGNNKDISNETLFGTMEKTLSLLQMGFSDCEISSVIERFGPDLSVSELADAICADQLGESYYIKRDKYSSEHLHMQAENDLRHDFYGKVKVKSENLSQDVNSQSRCTKLKEANKGKRAKQDYPDTQSSHCSVEEYYKGKRPKQEYINCANSYIGPSRVEEKIGPEILTHGLPGTFNSGPCKSLDQVVAKPPYFFYGDVTTVPIELWHKMSQFLYVAPEFVDTQFFSALRRVEGYMHNLPTVNRFHILPKPPMSIKDTLPNTEKWWPSWDARKQLSSVSCESSDLSQLCDWLGRILTESHGSLSSEQRRCILGHCEKSNLLWVGPHKLGPIEPEQIELILGYPLNHTAAAQSSITDRLQSLRDCFQIDTLGFHLSVLKSMFPEGVTMLSVFSGIGGAEIALHRLGIHLKGVVSVEASAMKRKILRTWWQDSKQTGQLEQIEDIQRLTTGKLEKLIEMFGDLDFVICQNSCSMSVKNAKRPVFDFSSFYEFVRVLQRVRSLRERKK